MELPNDISTVMQNAARYFMMHGETIPEFQRNKIINMMGPGTSPVDFVVNVAEALYAVKEYLDISGKELMAQTANLAAMNGWHDMTTRGTAMVNVARKDVGETVPDMPDPEIKKEFIEASIESVTPLEVHPASVNDELILDAPLQEQPN